MELAVQSTMTYIVLRCVTNGRIPFPYSKMYTSAFSPLLGTTVLKAEEEL